MLQDEKEDWRRMESSKSTSARPVNLSPPRFARRAEIHRRARVRAVLIAFLTCIRQGGTMPTGYDYKLHTTWGRSLISFSRAEIEYSFETCLQCCNRAISARLIAK